MGRLALRSRSQSKLSGPDPIGLGIEQDGTVDLSDGGLLSGTVSPNGAVSAAEGNFSVSPGDGIGYSDSNAYQVGPDTVTVAIATSYKLNRYPGAAGSLGLAAVGSGGLVSAVSNAADQYCGSVDAAELCTIIADTGLAAAGGSNHIDAYLGVALVG